MSLVKEIPFFSLLTEKELKLIDNIENMSEGMDQQADAVMENQYFRIYLLV